MNAIDRTVEVHTKSMHIDICLCHSFVGYMRDGGMSFSAGAFMKKSEPLDHVGMRLSYYGFGVHHHDRPASDGSRGHVIRSNPGAKERRFNLPDSAINLYYESRGQITTLQG